jgi:hypothetical protein
MFRFFIFIDKPREDEPEDDDKVNEKTKEREGEAIRERYLGII